MFNNTNDGDDDDSTEYRVVDNEGDSWGVFDTREEAEAEKFENEQFHDEWAPFTIEAVEDEPEEDAPGSTMDDDLFADDEILSAEDLLADLEEEQDDAPAYGFISNPEEDEGPSRNVTKWGLGKHSQGGNDASEDINAALSDLDESVDSEVYGLLQEASSMVDSVSVRGFECGTCGLNHGHSDTKHDIRYAFNITADFVELMEFCPFCHCGVNEMAMLIDFYGHIEADVFTSDYETVDEMSAGKVDDLLVEYSRTNSAEQATEHANVRLNSDVSRFLSMVSDIKAAASSAPISTETRNRIDELRDETEAFIQG